MRGSRYVNGEPLEEVESKVATDEGSERNMARRMNKGYKACEECFSRWGALSC